MNKATLVLRSVLIFSVLILQSVLSYALLTPAESEERAANKKKLVEATDHTISGSALDQYVEERERRREAEEDVDPEDRPKKGDPIDDLDDSSIHPEDQEFFEEKEGALDDGGPGADSSGEDFDPNKKP